MAAFLAPAVILGVAYLAPSEPPPFVPETPDVTIGTIDASKVPPERRVVFEGSKRVVSFPGSIHKVRF